MSGFCLGCYRDCAECLCPPARKPTMRERLRRAWKGWFWALEVIDGPVYWIYYIGLFSVVWSEMDGWHWGGFNVD